jgi:hypothetical protein
LEKAVADKDQVVSQMQSKINDDCCTIQALRLGEAERGIN